MKDEDLDHLKHKLNPVCWASANKDCSGNLTKEHVVSNSILKILGPFSAGLDTEKISFGSGSFLLKRLCYSHNHRLSPYDNEALQLFRGVDEHNRGIDSKDFTFVGNDKRELIINKWNLERWYAKTFMNLLLFHTTVFKPDKMPFFPSSHSICDQLYNGQPFNPPFGLYLIDPAKPIDKDTAPFCFSVLKGDCHAISKDGTISPTYEIPRLLYTRLLGVEIVGFFNITPLTDQEALESILKPALNIISERGIYDFGGYGYKFYSNEMKENLDSTILLK